MKFIVDCDPGNDTALAMIHLMRRLGEDLIAVTTVAGHGKLEDTTHNARVVVSVAGRSDLVVAAGHDRPILRSQMLARNVDLERGLDAGAGSRRYPGPLSALDSRHGVDVIVEAARTHGAALTLVATGAHTNLAMAIRRDPRALAEIARIIVLGGAWGLGNRTPAAEYNVLADPEATRIVLESGIPVTMVPVDVSIRATAGPDLLDGLAASSGDVAVFATDLLESLATTHRRTSGDETDPPIHDAVVAVVTCDPSVAITRPVPVAVETNEGRGYGRTYMDLRYVGDEAPNVDLVVDLDVDRFRAQLSETLVGGRSL